jgi:hypothetical protein
MGHLVTLYTWRGRGAYGGRGMGHSAEHGRACGRVSIKGWIIFYGASSELGPSRKVVEKEAIEFGSSLISLAIELTNIDSL